MVDTATVLGIGNSKIVDELLLRIDEVEEALEAGVEKDIRGTGARERRSLPLEVVCMVLLMLVLLMLVLLGWLAVELSDGCEVVEEVPWLLTVDDLVAWLSEDEEEGEGDSDGEDDKEDVGGCWVLDDEMLLMDPADEDAN